MWWGIPPVTIQTYGVTSGDPGGGVGYPGSYSITLRGEDRDGGLTVLQTWSGDIPVVQYDATHIRSAIGLDITLTPSVTLPDARFINYHYYASAYVGDFIQYFNVSCPFTPGLHPGITNDQVTGSRIPMGWLMKVRDAI